MSDWGVPGLYKKPEVMLDELAKRGPGELQRFLQDARAELAILDAKMQTAHDLLGETEERWVHHLDKIMEELDEEYAGKRLPGEDMRISIARRRGGAETWTNFRRAKRACERYDQRVSLLKAQISAAQSESKIGIV